MADQNYDTKLESLRRYIPFLVNMMSELKAKGNREAQLNKVQSLHDMITDTRKKLKLETLNRCEEVLTNIYYKVNPQYKNKGLPNSKTLPGMEKARESTTLPGIESPKSTPTSPSPPRDIFPTKPVTIPTEKINTPSSGLGSLLASKSNRPKINVYSNVVIHPARDTTPVIAAKIPDMSKPPISLDDLKTLEDDVQQKISDATFANASVDDLQAFRKELELQLRVDSVTSTMSPEKSNRPPINTTVRNNPSLSKKISFAESKSKTPESAKSSKISTCPIKESKTPTCDKKSPQHKEDTAPLKVSKDSTLNKSPQKVLKESSSIFGSLLSSIDNKLLEDKNKIKKGDRRSSITLSKDDSGSTTSLSSNKSNTKDTEAKTKPVEDKSKESKDKKSSSSHKHRRSSVDKEKHKLKEKSKDKSADRTDNGKDRKDKKKRKKNKHKSKECTDGVKPSKKSSDKGGELLVTDTDKNKDEKKTEKMVLLSDILLFNSKFSSNKNTNSDATGSSSRPNCDKNTHFSSTTSDAAKGKSDTINTASNTTGEKQQPNVSLDLSKTATVYKRLADKYNPKPKTKPAETEIPDVDKAVSDSIENFMKVSPAKPVLNSFGEPKSVLGGNVLEATTSQSNTPGFPTEQPKPIQLPEILQKIFSKPLLGDIIPKRLNENMFPLTTAAQNNTTNLGVNPMIKQCTIESPEPSILSPPRRPLNFQPPDVSRNSLNFMSPTHRQEFTSNNEMVSRPNSLLPTPGTQHGILPSPPIPPTLLRGFTDQNSMIDCSFGTALGTPRVDFDTPSTPMPDFDSPRVDFEPPTHVRSEFNPNQRFIPSIHQERQMNCFDPRNQNFMGQPQFQPQPEVNVFNNQLVPGMTFYGSNNQMPLINPEMPLYRPDQNYYQERAWHENARWARDRRPGDPRNYREYKEMRERQEREAKAAQEKQKEIKDPRLVHRDSKEPGEKDVRDPRLIRDSVDKIVVDKPEVIIRDPRLSRGREKSVDRERDSDKAIERDKNRDFRDQEDRDSRDFRSRDNRAKSRDREPRERGRSRERAILRLGDSSGSRDSRSRPRERDSRFDKMYSRTNTARSRSQSRDEKDDEEESFISPLDSLYNAGEKGKTGRGYGVQNFKIPRKPRIDDNKRQDEKRDERRTSSVSRKKRLIEIADSSDESDTNDVDNNSVPENESDVESIEEDIFEKIKDAKKKSKESVETIKEVKKTKEKYRPADVDTSRIKVIIKSDANNKTELTWQGDLKSLDAVVDDSDLSNFVSEYDKEFQLEKESESLIETANKEISEPIKSIKKAATTKVHKLDVHIKNPDVQVEEPSSSSQDVVEIAVVGKDSNELVEADSSKSHDDVFKKTAETAETDSSKKIDGALTPHDIASKSDEPSEQNILAHFFENLLKSKNKKDKKTALFSLIETFSDSFDTREIQKIRKIINVNEDEEEESEEEPESKVIEKTDDNKDSTPDITQTSAVTSIQEEQPVVGSTTEEVPTHNYLELKSNVATTTESLEYAETQVNEVTKSSEEIEQPCFIETKSEESLNYSKSELTETLEPVLVSVGERIKNRRRNLTPSKVRKKGKTELDMLHEDIQDMFIRDGVLTATGKRMCRILKDDPTALTTSVSKPETPPEQLKRVRRKPGPKPKSKINKGEVQNYLKDMRIVIKKMPDSVINANIAKKMPDNVINANAASTRQLRNRTRLSSYAESDDDSQKNTSDIRPHQLRKRNLQGSYVESDDDSQKSTNDTDTVFPEDNESMKSEIEGELSSESEGDDNKSQTSEGVHKPRVLRRRRGAKWASGIIPKFKKKKPQNKSEENSPCPSRAPSPDTNVTSIIEFDFDKLVEPDKEYFYDYIGKNKITCKLCKYSGHLLTGHYLKEHPQSEVLCSRLAPEVASEAIKDFFVNGKIYESIINKKMSTKYHYCCRVCGFTSVTSPIFFYEHVTTHTGEYRHQCGICEYFAVTGKTMAGHFLTVHPDQEKKAIRRTYTLAVVFGYICGECNFLQLKEKSVEDHANIFHLGEKPTIYKINMSTILDPIFNTLDSPREEQKALEPKLTNVTISAENDAPSESATETISSTSPKKRKKPCLKPKVAKETRLENNSNHEENPTLVIRKKPGPKSKTMHLVDTEYDTATEKLTEVPALTEQVPETPPAAPARKKPGPKSRTEITKVLVIEESSTVPESAPLENVDESIKEAPIRKRRRSLDKLISEDSGDDLDTIITLSSGSSRAAKEKATAKLKTLMESNEGLSTRKRADTDLIRKEKEIDKGKSQPNQGVEQGNGRDKLNQDTNKELQAEKETLNENQVDGMHPPSYIRNSSEKKYLNVFTCKTDILEEEEAKKIEEERLRKMEELNKSIGSRTSRLDFVDKLSNRLSNEQSTETSKIRVKQEPKDDAAPRAETPTMPVLEKELPLQLPVTKTPPLTKVSKSSLVNKKPVLDEHNLVPQSSINFRQNKSNSLFSNMIEKLQGKVNEAAVQQQCPSTSSQSLSEEPSSQRPKTPEILISIGDLIYATKRDNEIIYSCHANNCYVLTKDKMVFQLHCKFGHKDLAMTSSLCEKCGVVIEVTPDTSLLENLYDHLVFAHSDCIAKSSNLRMRRLSGDKLSVKQELAENKSINPSPIEKGAQDFEAGLDLHTLTYEPQESIVHQVTKHVTSERILLSAPTEASQDALPGPIETEPSIEISAPITRPDNIEIQNEEPVPSEATLELAEDNPFSFKIANVVSLAKSTGSEDQTQSPPIQKKLKQEPPMALIKPVPPLTLIGIPKQQASTQQSPLIVKEAKLSLADQSHPKKASKAFQKFVDTPGNLYKCPHYYCMFSTNVRTLLERHLKAHKCDGEAMIPCVYCDMKTPWDHVPMHIDIRHANCRFACSYCLYRACVKEYVCLHQEQVHPDKDYIVFVLPQHKAAKKFSVADAKIDYKMLCEPFRCFCKGGVSRDDKAIVKEYLFETEFTNHLNTVHQNKFAYCGYPGCSHRVSSSMMLNHWAMFHGICTYQCGYCKTSSKEITRIYTHFSQMHPSSQSDILVRVNDNLPKDRELGYSKEAFQKIGHIRKVPQNLLSVIGKRSQRSVKLVHYSGSSEEFAASEGTSTGTSLLTLPTLKQVQSVPGSQNPQQIFISNPNLQLLVASTTGGSEKLYLLPASMVSPNKGQSLTSMAPTSKVVAQTSVLKATVGKVGESVLDKEATPMLPGTTVAAISQSNLPQVPVKIGDTVIHPIEKVTSNTTTTTAPSHATIAVLSRSLLAGSSVTTQRLPKTVGNKNENSQLTGSLTCKIISSTTSLVPQAQTSSTISSIEPCSEVSAILSKKPTIDISDFMGPTIEETTSQDSSTGLSEDDILQSAIQSILDADDLSESNSNMTAPIDNFTNELDKVNSENTSKSHQGVFVDVGILESSPNISRCSTPALSPVSKTVPPPLVLISNSSKSPEAGTRSQSQQGQSHPSTPTQPTTAQRQNETTPQQVAPVEHVEVAGDVPDSSLVSEDIDPLNIDANEDSNLDPPCFDDINVGLDSPPEDPLTITPTFNSNLPSVDDPLSIDDSAVATDPLEVEERPMDNSANQSLTESSPGPLLIASMRRSMSMVSNSDEESDSSSSEKGKKRGLTGYQLYRCISCNLCFSNVQTFKSHLVNSLRCKKAGVRQYQCVHCEKSLTTPQRMADHIQIHGVPRFICSLCNEKFPIVNIAKLHMKNRHNIQQTNLIPLKCNQINMDLDDFMVKPGHANQPISYKDKESASESPNQAIDENTFNPDQIDIIPIRQIFSNNVKCGKCNYQTKVRVNIVRHLQMHLEEKSVPDIAPVNPVPCLEKNEKMFDKMFNLAASSITTGTSKVVAANQEEEKYPEFIPNHRRFVCSAHDCSYLCPEEANLKHHLAALHSDDPEFMCAHCKKKIEPTDPESIIKHLKLHGLHLYKCQYCSFVHHLKHKVEKHVTDGHLDAAVKVVTIRNMESEPPEFRNAEDAATPPVTSTTKFKPWRCCMCKVKCNTKEDIQQHIVHRHDIDTQYKCTLCTFKNDNNNSFRNHFKEMHPNHEIDVIFVYQKVEEEAPKDDTAVAPFDTTPLWQRDKPRVRHIRGILFDEISPQVTKSPKKPLKTYAGPSSKAGTGSASSTSTSVSKNIFDCIDAVARGTAGKLFSKTTISTITAKGNVASSISKGDIGIGSSEGNIIVAKQKVVCSEKKDDTKNVSDSKDVSAEKKGYRQNVAVDPFDSGNDDVIEIKQAANIIVIDSDDSDTEQQPPPPASKPDDLPKIKEKDSNTKPVSKSRGVKRQNTTDLLQEAVKMAKIEEPDPDDEDSIMVTNCSKEHLISIYGLFGAPHNKQWKCPKCHQFKSKRVGDFMFHIYKDFNVYRYKCKACSDLSITYKYMLDHISLHPGFTEEIIESLAPNVKLDTWIHMVIREQSLAILKNSPLMKKRPLTGPTNITCYFCNDRFMSMPDCCEHMLYHWAMMPYQCQHCPHEFYTVFDLKHHHKIEHPDLKLYLDPKGPTLASVVQCIENIKKRPTTKPGPQSPSRKKAKVEDTKNKKEPNVEVVGVQSGVVINRPPWVRRGTKTASVSPSTQSSLNASSTSKADVIRIDDDDDDLVIVSKTEETVQNEDEVYACEACAYVTDTENKIAKHLLDSHGIKTSKYHSLSKQQAEISSTQDMACNICDKVFSELKLRRHFLDNHLESHTFMPYRFKCDLCAKRYLTLSKIKMHFTRCHPGVSIQYKCAISNPTKTAVLSKSKLYSCTMCSYTNIGPNAASMRAHLRGHLRPVMCNHCNVRFRYHSDVQTHNTKEHPDFELDFTTLEDVQREFTETLKEISSKSTAISNNKVIESPMKNIARKSTSAPFMSPTTQSDEEQEYSYYGIPVEELNLSAVNTTFELDGLEYTTTAEQMMKMLNMDTFVDVSDCAVEIMPVDKS